MAEITSAQAGNWSVNGTWVGGVVPSAANDDTVIINHAIVVNENTAIGDSPAAGNVVVTINYDLGGRLSVASGFTFTLRGDLNFVAPDSTLTQEALLTLQAGSTLTFDSSQATDPTNQNYRVNGGLGDRGFWWIVIDGSSGSHVTINSAAGGGNGWFDTAAHIEGSNCFRATYCDCYDLGTASIPGIVSAPSYVQESICYWRNCTFTRCGTYSFLGILGDDTVVELTDCIFNDGIASNGRDVLIQTTENTPSTTGTRAFTRCVLSLWGTSGTGFTFDSCILEPDLFIGTSCRETTVINCLTRKTKQGVTTFHVEEVTDSYFLDEWVSSNPHGWIMAGDRDSDWSGCIISLIGTGAGDGIIQGVSTVPVARSVKNCIPLRTPRGNNSGCFVATSNATANLSLVIEHNTYFSGSDIETAIKVGEVYPGHAGLFSSIQSNIAWNDDPSDQDTFKFVRMITSTVQDTVAAVDADYNCGWNIATGEVKGYEAVNRATSLWSSGEGGANDIDVNPGFVDSTRRLATYDNAPTGLNNADATTWLTGQPYVVDNVRSLATAGIYGGLTVNYRCIQNHTSDEDSQSLGEPGDDTNTPQWRDYWKLQSLYRLEEDRTRIAPLLSWVFDGYAPMNTLLRDAGHDGGTIGASPFFGTLQSTVTASNTAGSSPVSFSWTEVSPP